MGTYIVEGSFSFVPIGGFVVIVNAQGERCGCRNIRSQLS